MVRYYFKCILIDNILKLINQYSMKIIFPTLLLNKCLYKTVNKTSLFDVGN